jgi:hypothetical protein
MKGKEMTAIASPACQLPEGYIPCSERLPAACKVVIAIRAATVSSVRFELLTARYDPEYRRLHPWRTIDGDAVTDSGNEVIGWRPAPELS